MNLSIATGVFLLLFSIAGSVITYFYGEDITNYYIENQDKSYYIWDG